MGGGCGACRSFCSGRVASFLEQLFSISVIVSTASNAVLETFILFLFIILNSALNFIVSVVCDGEFAGVLR